MHTRDYRDILGGVVLVGIGTFAAAYAVTRLSLGTISQMGPGMFPAALGCLLAALGVSILIPALFRTGEMPDVDIRSLMTVLVSIFAFAITVRPLGLIPAVVILTMVAVQADRKLSVLGSLVLAAGLSLTAALIFRIGLDIQVDVIAWPW